MFISVEGRLSLPGTEIHAARRNYSEAGTVRRTECPNYKVRSFWIVLVVHAENMRTTFSYVYSFLRIP